MQRVITINLNGNAYQLDERGYDALVAYLEQAERKLATNPDRDEILVDLEQAIAEKCLRYLGANKTVVTAAEVSQILAEMGPVEGEPSVAGAAGGSGGATGSRASTSSADAKASGAAPRRLYLIKEGAMIGGVCAGLAAYLGIDVTIVRIVFLVLTLLTKGVVALGYFVLMFVIPSANTSEERAAAHGEPFNAKELIDRAKKQYGTFGGADWKGRWRRERRQWRKQQRHAAKAAAWWGPSVPPPIGYAMRVGAGFAIPIFSALNAIVFWTFVYVVLSLVTDRAAFGEPLPAEVPMWVGLLAAFLLYNALSWPLQASRRASYYAVGGYHHGAVSAWDGLMSAGFSVLIVWLAYRYMPETHHLIESLPAFWDNLRHNWNH
jgi:phage shock protein PspC (stress-responsive transcriptional regulator)